MKRMAMYARVSSGRQEKEHTIESQIAAIEQHVESAGGEIDKEHRYIDDGWSGETLLRPGLDALRDAIALGNIDVVALYDADRLARRFVDQQIVLEEMARHQVEVMFVHGGLAKTPEEQMALGVRGIFAEYERAKILDRTRRGRVHRARSGVAPAWSNPPYGYRYLRGEKHQPGTVVVEECEATTVREIFTWVGLEGLRLRQVVKRLEERGIKTRVGRHWAWSTIGKMVRNRVYVGQAYLQQYEAFEPQHRDKRQYLRHRKSSTRRRPEQEWIGVRVPALVDQGLFDLVQQRMVENRRQTAGQVKHEYLLRGLLVCAACGRKMWAFGSGYGSRHERRYYACNGRDRYSGRGDQRCPRHPVRAADIENVVWNDLALWLQEPEQLTTQLEAQREQVRTVLDAHAAEQRRLQREMRTHAQAIERLVSGYQAGAISLEELRGRRERLEEAKTICQRNLEQLDQAYDQALVQRRVVDEVQQLKYRLRRGLDRCSWEDRRAIVELLIDKIEVDEPNLRVHYVVPLGTSGRGARERRTSSGGAAKAAEPDGEGAGGPNASLYQPCPREGARGRSARLPIRIGPRQALRPLVLGPASVPEVTDHAVAEREIELAVLSAMAHGNGPNGLVIATAAGVALLHHLDRERAAVYFHIIWDALREPTQRAFRELAMQQQLEGNTKFPPFMQEVFERGEREGELKGELKGLREGELKGKLKGLREALVRLSARAGIALGDEDRARIESCDDTATLERWVENILGAKTAGDVFS